MSKMSMPFGGRTITTTVSGGKGVGLLPLLMLGGGAWAVAIAIGTYAAQIELVLTIAAALTVIVAGAKPVYVLATELTWPWEARKVRAFSAQVDAAFDHQAAMPEPAAPLRVASERVHELEDRFPLTPEARQEIEERHRFQGLYVDREALEA